MAEILATLLEGMQRGGGDEEVVIDGSTIHAPGNFTMPSFSSPSTSSSKRGFADFMEVVLRFRKIRETLSSRCLRASSRTRRVVNLHLRGYLEKLRLG